MSPDLSLIHIAGGTVLGGQIPALTVFYQPSGHMDIEEMDNGAQAEG